MDKKLFKILILLILFIPNNVYGVTINVLEEKLRYLESLNSNKLSNLTYEIMDIDIIKNDIKNIIEEKEKLSLYYIGADTNEVYNGVVSNLTYDEVTKDSDNGVFTKVDEGNVVVKYVTVIDNSYENLIDDITLNGLVGTTYVTNEKTFDNYVLVETIGEVEEEFTLEDKEVIYVYKLKELPPKTGIMIESNNTNVLSLLLVAIIGLLIRKMK